MAFLVLLEALSPVERAVFMLREVFGYGYPDVARVTGKTEANCRQIFARARRRIAEGAREPGGPLAPPRRAEGAELAQRFFEAASGGDLDALLDMLAPPTWCCTGTAAARCPRSRGPRPTACGSRGCSSAACAGSGRSASRSVSPGSTAARERSCTTPRDGWRAWSSCRSRTGTCRRSTRSPTPTSCTTSARSPTWASGTADASRVRRVRRGRWGRWPPWRRVGPERWREPSRGQSGRR
ncbi:sigma factor-like helix-turn-helix DNA-binding protein [Nonomuraea salmonea]|uniref:sigma factor-like helix-turn-helix DNA-binding protein n=1 Tax=Nonomuraea salmonea TaxID=46181 RepID=UPI0031EA3893